VSALAVSARARSFIDRLLGRDLKRVHDEFIEAMRPSDQVEVALAEALAVVEEARRRRAAAQPTGRKFTPAPQPRPARIPSIPEDI
jgi:hypothetical protein